MIDDDGGILSEIDTCIVTVIDSPLKRMFTQEKITRTCALDGRRSTSPRACHYSMWASAYFPRYLPRLQLSWTFCYDGTSFVSAFRSLQSPRCCLGVEERRFLSPPRSKRCPGTFSQSQIRADDYQNTNV